MKLFERGPIQKLKALKDKLEGPGAKEYQDMIDEIVENLSRPCPFQAAILDFVHAPAEAGEGPTNRLEALAKVDDGSRPAKKSPCPDGDSCYVFHGSPATIGFEEAIRLRPRMYTAFLVPLLLGRPLDVIDKDTVVIKDMWVNDQVRVWTNKRDQIFKVEVTCGFNHIERGEIPEDFEEKT